MATTIYEFFGYPATDRSAEAVEHARTAHCPFLNDKCTKTLSDGVTSGACTLKQATREPVISCPIRLYADDYRVLRDVADMAFTPGLPLEPGASAASAAKKTSDHVIAVFGKRWGGELHLPQRGGKGAYYVDWILAQLNGQGELLDFVAIEVQSIDTTGNYRNAHHALLDPRRTIEGSTAGFNWENVNKRILPQLIYKGNILQREPLCQKGLFFVTPTPVYDKIIDRLGGRNVLQDYPLQSGSITFLSYGLDHATHESERASPLPLKREEVHTTSVVQVANAFSAPGALPPMGSYQSAIKSALSEGTPQETSFLRSIEN